MHGRRSQNSMKMSENQNAAEVTESVKSTGHEIDGTKHGDNMADMTQVNPGDNNAIAPNVQPLWFKEVSEKLSQIETMNKKLSSIDDKLSAAQDTANSAHNKALEAIENAAASHRLALTLQDENFRLKHEITMLKDRLIQQESQSRRNNLLFDGIAESEDKETWSDCEKLVKDIFVHKLGILDGGSIKIERAHRLGQKIPGQQRTVIVKFLSFIDCESVWDKRSQLKNSNIRMSQDFPAEINRERRILYPIFKKAKSTEAYKTAQLKVNKLFINNKMFTCKNLSELPEVLRPENLATKRGKGVTIFSSRSSLLSNLYSDASITIEGKSYVSTEQYFQHQKALHFSDDKLASQIMLEVDPYKIMSLGYKVKDYKEELWMQDARKILFKANMAKFTQNDAARNALLATGKDTLGEATLNPVYGIGLNLHDPAALDFSRWTGQNLFGRILEEIRINLQES